MYQAIGHGDARLTAGQENGHDHIAGMLFDLFGVPIDTWTEHGAVPGNSTSCAGKYGDFIADWKLPGSVDEMKRGDEGPSVLKLQKRLNVHGAGLVLDGQFGAMTESAVVSFQLATKLTASGIADAITITYLTKRPKGES